MENRCFACMNKLGAARDVCSYCGNDNSKAEFDEKSQLAPGMILRERFMVGFPLEHNGEGLTYIAYDTMDKKRVRIRELFPDNLCQRGQRGEILVKSGCEIQYKALMVDFAELSKQLIDIKSNNCLLKAKQIFSENNTLYTVHEDIAGVTLTRYLLEAAGELGWDATEMLFLPLLHTIKLLNSNGIIHRGISPDTIIVTKNNELKLTGICTSGVRAINSDIKPELFAGYAAPEQYQKCTSHGEWTDVYAISAVLYKTLTGTMPSKADVRDPEKPLVSPKELNSAIPLTVSDAIMRGLAYNKKERTLYIKDLIGDLYTSESHECAPQPPPQSRRVPEAPVRSRKKRFRVPVWLIVILITVPIMLGLLVLAYKLVLGEFDQPANQSSVPDISSSPPSSATPTSSAPPSSAPSSEPPVSNISVDNFMDFHYDDIVANEFYSKNYILTRKDVYHETAAVGMVVAQSVPANTITKAGVAVELSVSKGPQFVTVPPLIDETGQMVAVEDYKAYFVKNGLEVTVETKTSDFGIPGQIIDLSVDVGGSIDRETTKSVTIYVAG